MADIRQNPVPLDLFNYGPTSFYLDGVGGWVGFPFGGLAGDLWYRAAGSGIAATNAPTDTRAFSYYSPLGALDGDDQEIWAFEVGGSGSGKSWRLALTKDWAFAKVSGYSFTISVGTGGGSWFIRKYTNDANGVTIANGIPGPPTAAPGYCLLRRVGNDIQAWYGAGDPDTWILVASATDTSYMTGLWPTLWLADNALQFHGYEMFGGGPNRYRRAQIYRVLEGVRPAES